MMGDEDVGSIPALGITSFLSFCLFIILAEMPSRTPESDSRDSIGSTCGDEASTTLSTLELGAFEAEYRSSALDKLHTSAIARSIGLQ